MPNDHTISEYESEYGRVLWDKDTRSNYFQMVKERNRRKWTSAKHTPIHWGQDKANVEKCSSFSSQYKEERVTKLPSSKESFHEIADKKVARSSSCTGNIQKECMNYESCKCNTQSCCLKTISSHMMENAIKNNKGYSVHIKVTPTVKVDKENVKKSTKSRPETSNSIQETSERHVKHKIPTVLTKSVAHRTPKFYSSTGRPVSAPSASMTSQTTNDKKKPTFEIYGGNNGSASVRYNGGTRQTHNVRPKSDEVYSSALQANSHRERLRQNKRQAEKKKRPSSKQTPMKLHGEALLTSNKAKKFGLWVTEYQGNFKPFVY